MGSPLLFSFQLISLFAVAWTNVHYAHYHILSPEAAVGVPKIHTLVKVNELLLMAHNHHTNQLTPRNGYPQEAMGDTTFWKVMDVQCHHWEIWAENIFRSLVREMNATLPHSDLYYMQVLHTCELDEDTGGFWHLSRYSLNGEDMLYYQGGPKRWRPSHPAAAAIAESWNRERDKVVGLDTYTPQSCMAHIHRTAPFVTRKMDRPVVTVYSRKRRRGRLALLCHVADFYPRDIEVNWEQNGQAVNAERVTSRGILPNADHTFQTQLRISLEGPETKADEYTCVVRHASLRGMPLKVQRGSERPKVSLPSMIVALSALAVSGTVAVLFYYRRKKSLSSYVEKEPGLY